jgi:uncharacterized protein (TIGR02145 family)
MLFVFLYRVNKLVFFCVALVFCFGIFTGCRKQKKTEIIQETGKVTDIQGNVYNTVKIGNQWWMAENLRVEFYNDSSKIKEVLTNTSDTQWPQQQTGAFCKIDNRYGYHYNAYSLKKLAPLGWHIPTDEEWKTLEKELGMSDSEADKTSWRGDDESKKLIVETSLGWPLGSSYGTNESGFSALPGGCRLFNGTVGELSNTGFWWTSTETNDNMFWYRNVSSSRKTIFRYFVDKRYGFNVRCVKD